MFAGAAISAWRSQSIVRSTPTYGEADLPYVSTGIDNLDARTTNTRTTSKALQTATGTVVAEPVVGPVAPTSQARPDAPPVAPTRARRSGGSALRCGLPIGVVRPVAAGECHLRGSGAKVTDGRASEFLPLASGSRPEAVIACAQSPRP